MPSHQRGTILVLAALMLSLAVILLALIDIGFMYWDKREYQKAADLAAMAGANALAASVNAGNRNACIDADTAAQLNAAANLGGWIQQAGAGLNVVSVAGGTCGRWSPGNLNGARPGCRDVDTRIAAPGGEFPNVVRAVVSGTRKHFLLPGSTTLYACAIATTAQAQAQLKIRHAE